MSRSENGTSGSLIVTETPPANDTNQNNVIRLTLKNKNKPSVKWTEDVVDNEFLNKKSSKKCCIYSKPRRWDESDSESSGDEEDGHHPDCEHHK